MVGCVVEAEIGDCSRIMLQISLVEAEMRVDVWRNCRGGEGYGDGGGCRFLEDLGLHVGTTVQEHLCVYKANRLMAFSQATVTSLSCVPV